MPKGIKIPTGSRYGGIIVLREVEGRRMPSGLRRQFRCLCTFCGSTTKIMLGHIRSGHTKSCGCLSKTLNGLTTKYHSEYNTYLNMLARCYNPDSVGYSGYGGRGITVVDSWREDFSNFIEDMGVRGSANLTLDRIDPDGNYSKDNCRWADKSLQAYNQRLRRTNTSGYTGVKFRGDTNKWQAIITKNYKNISLGCYDTLEEALRARVKGEEEYYGEVKTAADLL